MTNSEPDNPNDKSATPTVALVGKPVTLSAIRRAEAQRIAAERAAAERESSREAPARPALVDRTGAPVVVKLPTPITVRFSQFFWILSLLVGAGAVVYLFVIRTAHLEDIAAIVQEVDPDRAEETYTTVADIISWTLFGLLVAILLVQVTAQVSYANRRPGTRWWMLGSLVVLAAVFVAARELVAFGDRGQPLAYLILGQMGLLVLGFFFALMPPALRWTKRGHDVAHRLTGEQITQ